MVSTVTTSTITTVTSMAALGLTTALGVAAVVALIIFLITKELASATLSHHWQLIGRSFSVPIASMLMVFAVIVWVNIAEILG